MPPTTTAICCTRCKTPLGIMLGVLLHVGAAIFDRPTALVCAVCGQRRVWTPPRSDAPLDSPNR